MESLEHSDGSEESMDLKTTDVMIQSKHDCMVVRVGQEADVKAHQSVQFVPDGHRIRSFEASFCNASECSGHRSEENVESE